MCRVEHSSAPGLGLTVLVDIYLSARRRPVTVGVLFRVGLIGFGFRV